jgi:hypothetical protein
MVAVFSEIPITNINTLFEQNVEFLYVNPGGVLSTQWALKGREFAFNYVYCPIRVSCISRRPAAYDFYILHTCKQFYVFIMYF